MYSMGHYLADFFVFKTVLISLTSVYSEHLNKVIWTLLKTSQVFIQTSVAQKGKTVQNKLQQEASIIKWH